MKMPTSLQNRLALGIGVCVVVLWAVTAVITAQILRHELDEVMDSALQETAQRILPLAVADILSRDTEGVSQRMSNLYQHDEYFTYVVRDDQGRVLLSSHMADPDMFPAFDGVGFRQTDTQRFYFDTAVQSTISIAMAEPLTHRSEILRSIQLGLALPLLLILPLTIGAIIAAVRLSLRPMRRLRDDLAARNARDLAPLDNANLPAEIAPVAEAVNQLFERLNTSFEAERSFASNAAHELRTPVAGAIAQAQRLRTETSDPKAAERASEIEITLKRLSRLSEKLMQLARAEGGRLRSTTPTDLRPILRLVADDFTRTGDPNRLVMSLPDAPVTSDIDPDALAILFRNLLENAFKYGTPEQPVTVSLTPDARLSVTNETAAVPTETFGRLTTRFEQGDSNSEGSGLGLAIVKTIAERADCTLDIQTPVCGSTHRFAVTVSLPH